eukprot:CAMPEP_0204343514 /NCGR_PEP_ID=MMETSP0469-20131031/24960_1 /ASSEMBLY_ACC=CAM_ASM_000384 /TAXON_ID=2969 /ORGANISM="Oxyrrhis marina" /LENGTH=304 /DNA_ID=CAMNT_0051328637 /DNA_START=9 /DNA_END=923 /DNA_ORIENTATION=+
MAATPTMPATAGRSFAKDLLAGGTAAGLSKTLVAPIERVKILMQTQRADPLVRSNAVRPYSGIRDCFSRVYGEQGVASLWRGNGISVCRHAPGRALGLAFKDLIRRGLPTDATRGNAHLLAMNTFAGGAGAGMATCVVYPLDYAQTRLASDVGKNRHFKGLWDCMVRTAKGPGGLRGLYAGMSLTIPATVLYRGCQVGSWDTITKSPMGDSLQSNLVAKIFLADMISIGSAYIVYPLDTIRRRLQVDGGDRPLSQRAYTGPLHCARTIWKQEGIIKGFYSGAGANAIRVLGGALLLVMYDEVRK